MRRDRSPGFPRSGRRRNAASLLTAGICTPSIRLDPSYADAYGNRGNAYRDKRDLSHALADYNEALRMRPGAIDYFNRGNAYYVSEDYDHAIADYTEAIGLDPTFARAYYNRGLAKRAKGDSAGGDADVAMARQRAH